MYVALKDGALPLVWTNDGRACLVGLFHAEPRFLDPKYSKVFGACQVGHCYKVVFFPQSWSDSFKQLPYCCVRDNINIKLLLMSCLTHRLDSILALLDPLSVRSASVSVSNPRVGDHEHHVGVVQGHRLERVRPVTITTAASTQSNTYLLIK